MYYTVYKTTNKINGKYYIGAHQTEDIEDNYIGSGVALKAAIEKYGKNNFTKEILYIVDSREEMYRLEKELVVIGENTYNLMPGGEGGWSHVDSSGDNNCMKNPEIARKVATSSKKTKRANKEYYDKISIDNLRKTWYNNKGKKRPEHSKMMKEKSSFLNEEVREKALLKRKKNASRLTLTSPDGITYGPCTASELNSLTGMPFANMCKGNTKLKRGKYKDWEIQKL